MLTNLRTNKLKKMTYRQYIIPFVLMLLTVFAACTDDHLTDTTGNESVPVGQEVYVSLTVAAEDASRSRAVRSPQPGEDGDGTEPGIGDENVIADLNVFFFDAGGDETGYRPGINASATTADATPVITFYTDKLLTVTLSDSGTGYTTGSRNLTDMGINLEMGKTYDVLVLANYGADYGKEYKTANNGKELMLATLRDAVIEAEPTTDDEGISVIASSTSRIIREGKFLMASADPASITVTPGTSITPATANVTLERLAARVDYHVLPEYTPTQNGQDKVKITGAVLCNDYAAEEYLFKRVTGRISLSEGWSEDIYYLGDETALNDGIASNYVLDPKTASADKDGDADFLRYYTNHNMTDEEDWKELTPDNSETYYTLGYTRENVSRVTGNDRPTTALCVVFRAEYIPTEIKGTKPDDYSGTFYWYNNQAYYTLNAVIDANSATVPSTVTDFTLTDYSIHKYNNGICYYTYYIRHTDDGDTETESPMEHATVRNNIYRLDVQSVSGPGGSGDIVVTVTLVDWREDINVYPDF